MVNREKVVEGLEQMTPEEVARLKVNNEQQQNHCQSPPERITMAVEPLVAEGRLTRRGKRICEG